MRFAALVALLFVAAAVALCLGPYRTSPADVFRTLLDPDAQDLTARIVREDRLPPVVLAILVGAALSVSGAVFQALLRNDLAEPYLIGVGPGAVLGVTVAAIAAGDLSTGFFAGTEARSLLAFLGGIAVAALVFGLARRGGRLGAASLVLVGVAVGALVSAGATGALYVAADDWHLVVLWLLGHLSPAPTADIVLVGVLLAAAGALCWTKGRDLDALTLGDDPAGLLGVHVTRTVVVLGGAASLLAAASVGAAGLIGFVGLVVPHLARGIVGPGHRRLLPACALLGGALLALADGLARTIVPPVPVGVVTALLGAPFLAWWGRR